MTYDAAERTPDSSGDCSAGTVLEEAVMRHRIPISTTCQDAPPTGSLQTQGNPRVSETIGGDRKSTGSSTGRRFRSCQPTENALMRTSSHQGFIVLRC